MKPDYDSLINAGLSKEEIAKISGCEDQEMQIRMLRKYRYKLLDEVHEKQQSLDAIDYMMQQHIPFPEHLVMGCGQRVM